MPLETKLLSYLPMCKKILFRGKISIDAMQNLKEFLAPITKVKVNIVAGDGTDIDVLRAANDEQIWYVVAAGCGKQSIKFMDKFDMVVDYRGDKINGVLRYVKEVA